MADINYEELEDLTLTMEDEDGTTTECELQFVFEYDGQDYGAFCEAENETGEFYFFSIDGSTNWKGETELEIAPVEDDALLEQLVDVLQQIIDSEMGYRFAIYSLTKGLFLFVCVHFSLTKIKGKFFLETFSPPMTIYL